MGPPARDLRYGWFAVSRAKGPMLLPTREEAPADPQRKQKQRHTLQFIRANQPQTNGGTVLAPFGRLPCHHIPCDTANQQPHTVPPISDIPQPKLLGKGGHAEYQPDQQDRHS